MVSKCGRRLNAAEPGGWWSRSVVLIASALTLGCFEYRQVPIAAAPVGKEVRVNLTDAGYNRLAGTAGDQLPRLRRTIEGPLISATEQSLLLGVTSWQGRAGTRETLHQRIAVPVSDVLGLERRMLDRRKTTIIAAGAGAALLAFIGYYVSGEFGGTTSPFPEPGQGESLQVPLIPMASGSSSRRR